MNKTVQELKVEQEPIKKTHIEQSLEMKNLWACTGISEERFTNRKQEMGDIISDNYYKTEEINTFSQKCEL